jgi:hypothetical protein
MESAQKRSGAMKSFQMVFALAAAGFLATAASNGFAQSSASMTPAAERMVAACQVVQEASGVQETLDRFDSGLAAHDIQQLQAAGIEPVSVKGWQKFFKSNPEATVTDNCPVTSLFLAGDKALWNCMETSTISSGGKPVQYARMVQFTFVKTSSGWLISDRK